MSDTNDKHSDDQIPGAEVPEPTQAMVVRDPQMPPPEKITPAQARVEAVADALKSAYAQASQLKLTQEEAAALAADFPDDAFRLGAGGDPNLIYIEHAYLRMRLNTVLGIGSAVPIRRREWAEEFQYYKDGSRKTGVRVYVDMVLIVRGCVVGEAIGDAVYYPDNAKTNYSDALESAKSNAFRRCCKEFGVGLQAWLKGWGEGWKARQRAPGRSGASQHPTQPSNAAPTHKSEAKPAAKTSEVVPNADADRDRKFRFLTALSEIRTSALMYFVAKGWITDTDPLDALPMQYVPKTKREYDSIMAELDAFMKGDQQVKPVEEWRAFLMPWGKQKGTPLAELEKKYLFGLWANYEVETEYNGNPKSEEQIAADTKFREMLDEAGKHYGFETSR